MACGLSASSAVCCAAVRSVAWHGRELLMVYSANVSGYKFPGGGVNVGETHARALARESQEVARDAAAKLALLEAVNLAAKECIEWRKTPEGQAWMEKQKAKRVSVEAAQT